MSSKRYVINAGRGDFIVLDTASGDYVEVIDGHGERIFLRFVSRSHALAFAAALNLGDEAMRRGEEKSGD